MARAARAPRSGWARPSPPPGHWPGWAGPARPSARAPRAPQPWRASGAGKRRHRRKARQVKQDTARNQHAEICRPRLYRGRYEKGTAMPNAIVMTGYGPPEVLHWVGVPLPEPGQGQIRIKVKAAGISPTDLALRAGYLKDAIPLPPDAVLGFEAAGTVDAVGPGVTGTSVGDAVTALLFTLGGYPESPVPPTSTRHPHT